jgi:hypothetical protein
LRLADHAMYEARAAGRNTIRLSPAAVIPAAQSLCAAGLAAHVPGRLMDGCDQHACPDAAHWRFPAAIQCIFSLARLTGHEAEKHSKVRYSTEAAARYPPQK